MKLKEKLTGIVNAGEEAVVRELLADDVQLDAEVRDVAALTQELIAEIIPLKLQAVELLGQGPNPGRIVLETPLTLFLAGYFGVLLV